MLIDFLLGMGVASSMPVDTPRRSVDIIKILTPLENDSNSKSGVKHS